MEFFFKTATILSVISVIVLFLQEKGTIGFTLTLITLIIAMIVSTVTGFIINKKA